MENGVHAKPTNVENKESIKLGSADADHWRMHHQAATQENTYLPRLTKRKTIIALL